MALSILDGNQSATTLSTILSSGQHITAHTVVSLGTQAITDMRSAVSGSVVSISNLPSTQTIAGTVTANVLGQNQTNFFQEPIPVDNYGNTRGNAENDLIVPVQITNDSGTLNANNPLPISGTVTANLSNVVTNNTFWGGNAIMITGEAGKGLLLGGIDSNNNPANIYEGGGVPVIPRESCPSFPISGTVTANTFAVQGTAVTTSNFTSITPSTVLASFNATREVLTIFNEGAGNLHICAGATCTTIAYQVRLSAGDYYEVPNHQTTITHSAVFATAGTARVTQVS
jgi:hypothetical protein